jgi:hypothetical protein
VLNKFDEDIFEGVVVFFVALFILLSSLFVFEDKVFDINFRELIAELSVSAGIFGLSPCLLNDLFD